MQSEPWSTQRVDPAAAAAGAVRAIRLGYGRILIAWTPVALTAFLTTVALTLLAGQMGLPDSVLTGTSPDLTVSEQMTYLGLLLPLSFVLYTVTFLGWGLVAREVGRILTPDETPRPIAWGPLLLLGAALSILYATGLAMLIIGFLVFLHWFLYAPAVLAQSGGTLGGALEASRKFARDRRTLGFTALVVLTAGGIYIVQILVSAGVIAGLEGIGLPKVWASALASTLATWLGGPLLATLPAAYWALTRREGVAAATEFTEASQASATTTPAKAQDRFRTTKCPQCGTLVPYTSTGMPMDVTCPVCARSGRVL